MQESVTLLICFKRQTVAINNQNAVFMIREFGIVNLLPTNEQRELTYRVFFPEDTEFLSICSPSGIA